VSGRPTPGSGTPGPRPALANDYLAPRDDSEAGLARIWEAVFGVSPVGVDDDFFDLGGDSLHAFALVAAVARIAGVSLRPRDLFEAPTIAEMAKLIEQRSRAG
jgi:acyl carrier protein